MTALHAVLKKFTAPGKARSPGLAAVEISDLSSNGKKTVAKRFGAGRITGLALIAVLTLALGYLHFAGSSTAVSVPAGAHAGQLTLKSCTYNTEKGAFAADCGTLVVPENRHDPNSRLIALPVTVIRAHSADPGAPIFRLQGGPGTTNMVFPDASRFTANHDVVLVGYRGVDGSVRLDCPEVVSALKRSADYLGAKSFHAYSNAFRSCAKRLQADGLSVVRLETHLTHRFYELTFERFAMQRHLVETAVSLTYWNSEFTVVGLALLWVYVRRHDRFIRFRNWILLANVLGLFGYVFMPTAPPRMFPSFGFIDSHRDGLVQLAANPYAAMPSLHTAYALTVGTTGLLVCRHLLMRLAWTLYPGLVVYSIIATGNHFVLDAIAGVGVAAFAALLALAVARGCVPRHQEPDRVASAPRLGIEPRTPCRSSSPSMPCGVSRPIRRAKVRKS